MATVLIGGGTGLIGTRLSEILEEHGYTVEHLSRSENPDARFPAYAWDTVNGTIDEAAVARADYVINLAGAGIADKPWTDARKRIIIESRTKSTRLLLDTFRKLDKEPKAYLSSAAIGIYGDRGDEVMTEDSEPGKSGFLAESCKAWEQAIREVAATSTRTVALRIGVVLSTKGGALEKMLIPLKLRTATYFGDGSQWFSWIHIDDVCQMFLYALENENLEGFYNAVAPNPKTNKQFTEVLADAYGKSVVTVPAPAFALRLGMGEMADTVLGSTKVSAQKIQDVGFEFKFPELKPALQDLLERRV